MIRLRQLVPLTDFAGFPAILICFGLCCEATHAQEFAYVTNSVSGNVSAFVIDPTTGALTPVPGSPFPSGAEPLSAAADPSGRFLYVSNGMSNDVWAYTINATSGVLTPLPGSPFPAGSICHSVIGIRKVDLLTLQMPDRTTFPDLRSTP